MSVRVCFLSDLSAVSDTLFLCKGNAFVLIHDYIVDVLCAIGNLINKMIFYGSGCCEWHACVRKKRFSLAVSDGLVSTRLELTNHVYVLPCTSLGVSHAFGFLSVSRAQRTINTGR